MLIAEAKKEIIKNFALNDKDTGSSQVQIAILTERISQLSGHLNNFPKDKHSKLGLVKLVSKRRKLLKYLAKNDSNNYKDILKKLKTKEFEV